MGWIMWKRLLAVLALGTGAMVWPQSPSGGPFAVMDPTLGQALFAGVGSSATLTSLDGTQTLTLTKTDDLQSASGQAIEVIYCRPTNSTATVQSLVQVQYEGPFRAQLPQCPSKYPLWLAKATDGSVRLIAQGGNAFNQTLDVWTGKPVDSPTRGYFLEATNLLIRGVASDLTAALFDAAGGAGKTSIPIALLDLGSASSSKGFLVQTAQGQTGQLILEGSSDLNAGSYLISSLPQISAPLDPSKVFPATVAGSATASSSAPVTISLATILPFTPPQGPVSYPVNTTFSWRDPSGAAAGAAIAPVPAASGGGAGGIGINPDPTSEGMLALWKALPLASGEPAAAEVRIPTVSATLTSSLRASFSAGTLTISLDEPTMIPVPGPFAVGNLVTTSSAPFSVIKPSVAVNGFLSVELTAWKELLKTPPRYLAFSGPTTSQVQGVRFEPPTSQTPFGQFVQDNTASVTLDSNGSPVSGEVVLSSQGETLSLNVGNTTTLSLSDWLKAVSAPGATWQTGAEGNRYQALFSGLPDSGSNAFTSGTVLGTLKISQDKRYAVQWASGSQEFLSAQFPKGASYDVAYAETFNPVAVAQATLGFTNGFFLTPNSGTSDPFNSQTLQVSVPVGQGKVIWRFKVAGVDQSKRTIVLDLLDAWVLVKNGSMSQTVTRARVGGAGGVQNLTFSDSSLDPSGWLQAGLSDLKGSWLTVNNSLPSSGSGYIVVEGYTLTASRLGPGAWGFSLEWDAAAAVFLPLGNNVVIGTPGESLTFSFTNKSPFIAYGSIGGGGGEGLLMARADYQKYLWSDALSVVNFSIKNDRSGASWPAVFGFSSNQLFGDVMVTPPAPAGWKQIVFQGMSPDIFGQSYPFAAVLGKFFNNGDIKLRVQVKNQNEIYVKADEWEGLTNGETWVTNVPKSPYAYTATIVKEGSIMLAPAAVQDCKAMLQNTNFDIYGWQCNQPQPPLDPKNLGFACKTYQCESTSKRRGNGGEPGCGVHDNWQMSNTQGEAGECYVVNCQNYGSLNDETNEGGQCSGPLQAPSPNNNLCIWCPNNVLQGWVAGAGGCGVVPYLPSVNGWWPYPNPPPNKGCTTGFSAAPYLPESKYNGP
jgi:hypothetical protein